MSNEEQAVTQESDKKVKEILEKVHVRYLGDGTVELTHGIDKCVHKVHQFPQHLRGED